MAKEDFFSKDNFTKVDLEALITNLAEESVQLEFKSAGSLQMTDGKKNELAKDVSAFANSDGGILIYGINEVDHIANSFSFIDGNLYTKEWIENVIQSRIARRIPNLMVYPIRIEDDFARSIYIIKIPRASHAPHMTSEKKYFKRLNFQAIQMEEHEVRDMYGRKDKTNLTIGELIIADAGSSAMAQRLVEAKYKISFQVKNEGNTIENQYKLEIAIPLIILKVNTPINVYKIRSQDGFEIFSIPNSSPLFQEELTTVAEFTIIFNSHNKSLLNSSIRAKLYFSGGVIERKFTLKGLLLYQENSIYDIL